MDFLTVLLIAVSLAMDAFAVSVIGGATIPRLTARSVFRLSFHFGLFQFLMPVAGWLLSRSLIHLTGVYSGWIAFLLLTGVGLNMIREGMQEENGTETQDISRGWSLVSLSVATSLDALAIGITLGLMTIQVLYPALIIGIVASAFSLAGIYIGKKTGHLMGGKIHFIGGLILIGIGVSILFRN